MKFEQFGCYLYPKQKSEVSSLKEILQFLRSQAPGKSLQFSYVESETSLIPTLSLWENLHVVVGGNWKDFIQSLDQEWQPIVNLIIDPEVLSKDASCWERLLISLLKAHVTNYSHVVVDLNEGLHSPLNMMNFKKMLMVLAKDKNIYIASANTSLWLDSCHSLVVKKEYQYEIKCLDQERLKRPRIA